MKGLKIAAIASAALVVVLALLTAYLFLMAEVRVVDISAEGLSAANDASGFEALKTAIDEQTFVGTLYHEPTEWKDAGDYVWITYTITLDNGCLVPIDMLEAQVVPLSGDVLASSSLAPRSLDPKTRGDITATILAPKDAHPVRDIIVTYYVWGVSFSVTATYGA